MSIGLKLHIGRRITEDLKVNKHIDPSIFKSLLQVNKKSSKPSLKLDAAALQNEIGVSSFEDVLKLKTDEKISSIELVPNNPKTRGEINFSLNPAAFVQDVMDNCTKSQYDQKPKKIVVEFSSPNIAKPFHMGHFRSTIIGNFVANIHEYLGHKVVRLNYLGDWGTQFGMIKTGLDLMNYSEEQIQTNPIQKLYEAYISANKSAETDPEILEKAKSVFLEMEKGDETHLTSWKTYLGYTEKELRHMYQRLGVAFDEFNFESSYKTGNIRSVIDLLQSRDLLKLHGDGMRSVETNGKELPLIKSDGSSLYLLRDLAAALHRHRRFEFDNMIYVVDSSQSEHMKNLKNLLNTLGLSWAENLRHVRFGRVNGMSTRKGNAVFLKDILDECLELVVAKQKQSINTKVSLDDTQTSDILGISCLIVNDLKQRRNKNYNFSWENALQVSGDSGASLQYTHCRLCSIEKNCGIAEAEICDHQQISELEAYELIRELARFQDVLARTYDELEPSVLVLYLFHLCNHINVAVKKLRVKGETEKVGSQRLLLFNTSRRILGQGMQILGLRPLESM